MVRVTAAVTWPLSLLFNVPSPPFALSLSRSLFSLIWFWFVCSFIHLSLIKPLPYSSRQTPALSLLHPFALLLSTLLLSLSLSPTLPANLLPLSLQFSPPPLLLLVFFHLLLFLLSLSSSFLYLVCFVFFFCFNSMMGEKLLLEVKKRVVVCLFIWVFLFLSSLAFQLNDEGNFVRIFFFPLRLVLLLPCLGWACSFGDCDSKLLLCLGLSCFWFLGKFKLVL